MAAKQVRFNDDARERMLSALAARTMKISELGQAVGADPPGHCDPPAKTEGSAQ
jgi:hypothetical protein